MRVTWMGEKAPVEGTVVTFIGGFDGKGVPDRTHLLVQVGDRLQHVPYDAVIVLDDKPRK